MSGIIKNKKAALELSIGTIVIIVIAVAMLILGIVFVRSIMCSGIQIGEDVSQGVKNEIKSLFSADNYGVKCEGEGTQDIKLASGGMRKVICIVKTDAQAKYDFNIKSIKSLSGASDSIVKGWLIDRQLKGFVVTPGGDGAEAVIASLNLPQDAPKTTLSIVVDVKNENTGNVETHILDLNIEPAGFFKSTIC